MFLAGFETKKYDDTSIIHIKYYHYGFAVIDLRKDSYNLYVLEGMFPNIGVRGFERISNMRNKTNRIRSIPYEDTVILEKL